MASNTFGNIFVTNITSSSSNITNLTIANIVGSNSNFTNSTITSLYTTNLYAYGNNGTTLALTTNNGFYGSIETFTSGNASVKLPLALNAFGGNVSIGYTGGSAFTFDVNGTARVTSSISTANVYSTNQTTTNIVTTNISAGNYINLPQKVWNASSLGLVTTTGQKYYKVATLATTADASNENQLSLQGWLGGYNSSKKISFDITICTGSTYDIRGTARAVSNTPLNSTLCDFRVYLEADNTYSVYVILIGQYSVWEFVAGGKSTQGSGVILYEPNTTFTSSPTGSLQTLSVLSQLQSYMFGSNLAINNTAPSFNIDVTGTGRISTSLTTDTLNSTNQTTTNVVGTNISTSTLNLSTALVSTSLSSANVYSTNLTTTNIVGTNISTSTLNLTSLNASTSISSAILFSSNQTTSNIVGTNISTSNFAMQSNNNVLSIQSNSIGPNTPINIFSPNLTSGSSGFTTLQIGVGASSLNASRLYFYNSSSGSVNNYLGLGLWGNQPALIINGNNFIGIGTTLPNYILDVVGSANISSSLSTNSLFSTNLTTTNIVGTNITSTNAQFTTSTINNLNSTNITTTTLLATTQISSGSLYSTNQTTTNIVGTRISTSNLFLTGNVANVLDAKINNILTKSYNMTVGTTGNAFSNICTLTVSSGACSFMLYVDVMQSQSGDSVSKSYNIPINFATDTAWYTALPINSSLADWDNVALQVQVNSPVVTLRLLRNFGTSQASNWMCIIRVFQTTTDTVTIADSSTTGTGGVTTGIFQNTTLMQSNSQVGINTTQPASGYKLDVQGLTKIFNTGANSSLTIEQKDAVNLASLRLLANGQVTSFNINASGVTYINPNSYTLLNDSSGNLAFQFQKNNANSLVTYYYGTTGTTINTGNYFNMGGTPVGTTGGAFIVYNQASTGVYLNNGATAWSANSDLNLKKDIVNIDSSVALNKIIQLEPVKYRLKTDLDTDILRPGLIAQETQKVLPELITTNNDKYLGIKYTDIIPYLIGAIKELENQIRGEKVKD